MALHQPTMVRHAFPWRLELVGAAILGAALLFGVLVALGHTDLLPWTVTTQQPAVEWMGPEFQSFRQGEILGTQEGAGWLGSEFEQFRHGEIRGQ